LSKEGATFAAASGLEVLKLLVVENQAASNNSPSSQHYFFDFGQDFGTR
jgi:hypothetical protein